MKRMVFLCRLDELPDGQSRGFDPLRTGNDTMLVVRRGRSLYAWHNDCPHQSGTAMAWRKDAYLNREGSRIVCHAHGAQFDIATGICTLGPCLGQSLTPVPLLLDSADHVHVVLGG